MTQSALFDADLAPVDLSSLPSAPFRYAPRPQISGTGYCTGWWREVPGRPEYAPWPLLEREDDDDGLDYRFAVFALADGVFLMFRPGTAERCLETEEGERMGLQEALGRGLAWEMGTHAS